MEFKKNDRVILVKASQSFYGRVGMTGTIYKVENKSSKDWHPMFSDCSILWDGDRLPTYGYSFGEIKRLGALAKK